MPKITAIYFAMIGEIQIKNTWNGIKNEKMDFR
jgi:hypothetical protein